MKVKILPFHMYVQKYTLESMINTVIYLSFDVFNNSDEFWRGFAGYRNIDIHNKVLIVQTWLIDMLYDLISYKRYGKEEITIKECLILISYYNDYKDNSNNHISAKNILFNFYGFFGEQRHFEKQTFFEEYAREKYILEKISIKSKENIDVLEDFKFETNMSTDEFSAIIFALFCYSKLESSTIETEKT